MKHIESKWTTMNRNEFQWARISHNGPKRKTMKWETISQNDTYSITMSRTELKWAKMNRFKVQWRKTNHNDPKGATKSYNEPLCVTINYIYTCESQ